MPTYIINVHFLSIIHKKHIFRFNIIVVYIHILDIIILFTLIIHNNKEKVIIIIIYTKLHNIILMFISLPHFSNMGHLYIWINSCETKNPNENAKFSTDTARVISLFLTALYTYIFFEILFL